MFRERNYKEVYAQAYIKLRKEVLKNLCCQIEERSSLMDKVLGLPVKGVQIFKTVDGDIILDYQRERRFFETKNELLVGDKLESIKLNFENPDSKLCQISNEILNSAHSLANTLKIKEIENTLTYQNTFLTSCDH